MTIDEDYIDAERAERIATWMEDTMTFNDVTEQDVWDYVLDNLDKPLWKDKIAPAFLNSSTDLRTESSLDSAENRSSVSTTQFSPRELKTRDSTVSLSSNSTNSSISSTATNSSVASS